MALHNEASLLMAFSFVNLYISSQLKYRYNIIRRYSNIPLDCRVAKIK